MRSRADAVPAFVWVPEVPSPDTALELDAPTLHHVRRVCRARPGDALALTDGRGVHATARLEADGRVHVIERRIEPPPAAATIACGVPDGERADWLVEKLAEFGIAAFQPIDTARTRWRPERTRTDRWLRLARAALGQSRGAWQMEIRPPVGWDEFVASTPPGATGWFADPEGERAFPIPGPEPRDWVGVVGPAAGLESGEKEQLVGRGFRPIWLSQRRLRTETAALALAAVWATARPDPVSEGVSGPPS
jgi:16S rRNA (uracil1498-N3)-methyltransferase